MRVICVGNGLAGVIFSKTLRELDAGVEIDIFAEEKYHYYPRPNLIEFLAGNISEEKIFAFSEEWYRQQKIRVHLENPVQTIYPDSQEVVLTSGARKKYHVLFLATGSKSFLPPFQGADKKGVFTLRTLDDAKAILSYLPAHRKVAVVGGGLLGLEIARALKTTGAEVEIVEFFPNLLPRQLDPRGSSLLKTQVEKMGIRVHLELATEGILGRSEAAGLRFKGGQELAFSMIIVAAGVRSNTELAKKAGLDIDRGLIVNDSLQTSSPKIFAAGDAVQHRGRIYGIIPSSFEQARAAAFNVAGQNRTYEGTVPSNTLKVMGIHLTSIGVVNPEKGAAEEIKKEEREKGIYKKIVVQGNKVIGAIWIGTKTGVNGISRLISQEVNVEKQKESLLEDNFDFSSL